KSSSIELNLRFRPESTSSIFPTNLPLTGWASGLNRRTNARFIWSNSMRAWELSCERAVFFRWKLNHRSTAAELWKKEKFIHQPLELTLPESSPPLSLSTTMEYVGNRLEQDGRAKFLRHPGVLQTRGDCSYGVLASAYSSPSTLRTSGAERNICRRGSSAGREFASFII